MKPYIIFVTIFIWAASLLGTGIWQNRTGHTEEQVVWLKKDNLELAAANQKIQTLEEHNRTAEEQHSLALVKIATDYEKELKNANIQYQVDLAAIRNGSLQLRDPGPVYSFGSSPSQAAASTCGSDGSAGRELSGTASEFLLNLVTECDANTRQLQSCQKVVTDDRMQP